MDFKFNATNVDAIEKAKGVSIESCIADTTVNGICLFIEKGHINEHGGVGISRSLAFKKFDEYLEDKNNDKEDLLLDITEALCEAGFLSRELDVESMRIIKKKKMKEAKEALAKAIQ